MTSLRFGRIMQLQLIQRFLLFIILVLLMPCLVLAQGESNYWYFGIKAGLNFNAFPANALTNGQVNAHGGSSSISDANGNLLFYSQGMMVWNQNHTVMPNGYGLLGSSSSTQNSIIIPKPGSSTIYYLFTNGAYTDAYGLHYSEIDMSLNGGLGDVTSNKNIVLLDSTTEKLSATYHFNETDVWGLTHERNTNAFYAYLVTAAGISSPVITNIGIVHDGNNSSSDVSVGQMKFSPDGSKVALATSANNNTFEIFDFNNLTGQLSNPLTISGTQYANPYGVEFSPDGTLLYCSLTNSNKVYQFNLQAGSNTAIINSGQIVVESGSTNIGGLQLGPDSRLYLARYMAGYLGVFNNPNFLGSNSNYTDDGISLSTKKSRRGLPNFITSFFNNPRFIYTNTCFGDSTQFYISDLNGVISVLWNFGDPASGVNNTSTLTSPFHIFSNSGTFQVSLIRNFNTFSDTVMNTVNILPLPQVNLGSPIISICEGSDTVLFAGAGFASYLWQNGSITPTLTASTLGMYSVTVSDDYGCENSDSVEITHLTPPSIDLGPDTYLCEGNSLTLNAYYEEGEYIWSNGLSVASIVVNQGGDYSVTVSNRCGETQDSIHVDFYTAIDFDLGADQDICIGDTILLDPNISGFSYSWSTGSSNQSISVTNGGTYSLEVYYYGINCPSSIDSVKITLLSNPTVSLGNDTSICEGEMLILESMGEFISDYQWSTGEQSESITVNQAGTYLLVVSNICASDTDSVSLVINPLPDLTISSDTSIYSDESYQLESTFNSTWIYIWTPATALSDPTLFNPVASPQQSITYQLEVTDTSGCRETASVHISVSDRPLPELVFYNTFTPNDDGINDFWVIENVETYENSLLEVYNRNGNLVYSKKHYQNDWDGRYKDEPLPAHTYFFIFYPGEEGREVVKGTLTIIR